MIWIQHLATNCPTSEETSLLAFEVERWWIHDIEDRNPHVLFVLVYLIIDSSFTEKEK